MPSSKDPVINRQKAREYRLAHPDWHRKSNREWMRKKRARLGRGGRAAKALEEKNRDPVGYLLNHAKQRAAAKGVPFSLAREDIVIGECCPVLGLPFVWGRGQMGWRNMRSPSLDRVKPQLGYVSGNVRVISTRANHIKGNATISEMEAVLAYMKREGANQTLGEQDVPSTTITITSIPDPQLTMGW